jgi:hypothetical protein
VLPQNLPGEFGLHLVSVKTASTESRVAGRHRRLAGFPGKDRTAHSTALSRLPSNVPLGIALHDLRSGRWLVGFGLPFHFFNLGILCGNRIPPLLLHDLHLLLLRGLLRGGLCGGLLLHLLLLCCLIGGSLLHLLLLLLRLLLLLLAWAFASASKPR